MTKDDLQQYIILTKAEFPMLQYYLGELSTQIYAKGYAKDRHGWYVYSVNEKQKIDKKYLLSEQECIDVLFRIVELNLKNARAIETRHKKDKNKLIMSIIIICISSLIGMLVRILLS